MRGLNRAPAPDLTAAVLARANIVPPSKPRRFAASIRAYWINLCLTLCGCAQVGVAMSQMTGYQYGMTGHDHPMFGSTAYLEDAATIDKTKDAARAKVRTLFQRADAHLQGREWLADTRSIADPYLYVTYRWARANGVDLGGLRNLAAFASRIEADPAVQKVLRDEGLA